jgi:hypothetical protein
MIAMPALEPKEKVEASEHIKVIAKTAESYDNPHQEPHLKEAEEIPMMPLLDIKISEAGSEMPPIPPACMMEGGVCQMFLGEHEMEEMEVGYIYEQMRMLEVRREWHIHNANLLESQLINQKNDIYNCGAAIEFYQRVLHSRP